MHHTQGFCNRTMRRLAGTNLPAAASDPDLAVTVVHNRPCSSWTRHRTCLASRHQGAVAHTISSSQSLHACQTQGRPLPVQPRRGTLLPARSEDIRSANMERALVGEVRTRRGAPQKVYYSRCPTTQNFGARDPFAGEVATDFGNKALGHASTEHIVKCVLFSW